MTNAKSSLIAKPFLLACPCCGTPVEALYEHEKAPLCDECFDRLTVASGDHRWES